MPRPHLGFFFFLTVQLLTLRRAPCRSSLLLLLLSRSLSVAMRLSSVAAVALALLCASQQVAADLTGGGHFAQEGFPTLGLVTKTNNTSKLRHNNN